jgi:hypothetical protein
LAQIAAQNASAATVPVGSADGASAAVPARNVNPYVLHVDDNPSHNRRERYYYMVESFNSSPFTSQSLAVSWTHQGPKYFDIPLKLAGDWVVGHVSERDNGVVGHASQRDNGQIRLAWEQPAIPATLGSVAYYYCVFRKLPGDKRFRYVTNVPSTELEYTDNRLESGETAEYYILLRFEDGRESQQSNTVQVTRNK